MSIKPVYEQRYSLSVDHYEDSNQNGRMDPDDQVSVKVYVHEQPEADSWCDNYTEMKDLGLGSYSVGQLLSNRTIFRDLSPAEVYYHLSDQITTADLSGDDPVWKQIASDSVDFHLGRLKHYASQGDVGNVRRHLHPGRAY